MPVTPVYALPYPSLSDAPNGPAQFQALAEAVESKFVSVDSITSSHTASITLLNRLGIKDRASRSTDSTATATEIGVLRLDDVPILAGRIYAIQTTPLGLDSTSTNDEIIAQFRFTTDGSTPTTASTVLPGGRVQVRQTDSNVPEHKTIYTTYTPAANETLSLLLTVARLAGAGNVRISPDTSGLTAFTVVDLGVDPGNHGTSI